MFGRSTKEGYVQGHTSPLAVSGCNNSPYMQDMLKQEEKRRIKQNTKAYNRRQGFIK